MKSVIGIHVSSSGGFFFFGEWPKSKVRCDRFDVFISEPTYLCISSANPCT